MENNWTNLAYHHSRALEFCYPRVVEQAVPILDGEVDESLHLAYKWIQSELGFYPIFLAVGRSNRDIRMTGYSNQWKKDAGLENQVLFSFNEMPKEGVFMDYDYWHIVLNSSYCNYQISPLYKRWIFKNSWDTRDWIRKTERDPHSVQLVIPRLDLNAANLISVRNLKTKEELIQRGFNKIIEKRRVQTRH